MEWEQLHCLCTCLPGFCLPWHTILFMFFFPPSSQFSSYRCSFFNVQYTKHESTKCLGFVNILQEEIKKKKSKRTQEKGEQRNANKKRFHRRICVKLFAHSLLLSEPVSEWVHGMRNSKTNNIPCVLLSKVSSNRTCLRKD